MTSTERQDADISASVTDLDPRWHGAVIFRNEWHLHSRLLRRYGLVLAPGEFTAIWKAIRNGRALRISDRGHGDAIYAVQIPRVGGHIYVVATRRRLITALRPSRRLADLLNATLEDKQRGQEL